MIIATSMFRTGRYDRNQMRELREIGCKAMEVKQARNIHSWLTDNDGEEAKEDEHSYHCIRWLKVLQSYITHKNGIHPDDDGEKLVRAKLVCHKLIAVNVVLAISSCCNYSSCRIWEHERNSKPVSMWKICVVRAGYYCSICKIGNISLLTKTGWTI